MITDVLGNPLNIGDTVAYAQGGTTKIRIGTIKAMETDKFRKTFVTIDNFHLRKLSTHILKIQIQK